MSNPTPSPRSEWAAGQPITEPDLSPKTVDLAVTQLTGDVKGFLPAKARAAIYTIAGVGSVAAFAMAPVVGGQIAGICDGVAQALAAVGSAIAISHITK